MILGTDGAQYNSVQYNCIHSVSNGHRTRKC